MKILLVHNRYWQSRGGEDNAVEAEASLLTNHEHTVRVVYFDNYQPAAGLLSKTKAGIKAIYNKKSAGRLKEIITAFNPAIIHIHNFFFEASPAVFYAARSFNIPVVCTLHNYRLVCVNALLLRNGHVCEACIHSIFPWKGVVHKCYHNSAAESALVGLVGAAHKLSGTWTKRVDQFITPSSFMREKLLHSSLGIRDAEKIAVKRNFIEDPGEGDFLQRGSDYLFVGRLTAEKGIHFLLRCFAEWKHLSLIVVGEGPEQETLIKQYSHCSNIIFRGKLDKAQIIPLMQSSRALLFPSIWYEGLPVTIVEALATGMPVIASNLGAMQEMIQNNYNGLLFEKENASALQHAIQLINQYYENKDYRLNTGARQSFLENFHPTVCYQKTMEIYGSVIDKHKRKKTNQ